MARPHDSERYDLSDAEKREVELVWNGKTREICTAVLPFQTLEHIKGAEEIVARDLFNKPEDFFKLDKLRKAVSLDRRITLRKLLAKVFGDIDRFKTKDELLEDELAKFVLIHQPDAAHMPVIRQFFKAYVTDGGIRAILGSREFGQLAANPKISLAEFRALDQWRAVIPEYVKDYVHLNQFLS